MSQQRQRAGFWFDKLLDMAVACQGWPSGTAIFRADLPLQSGRRADAIAERFDYRAIVAKLRGTDLPIPLGQNAALDPLSRENSAAPRPHLFFAYACAAMPDHARAPGTLGAATNTQLPWKLVAFPTMRTK